MRAVVDRARKGKTKSISVSSFDSGEYVVIPLDDLVGGVYKATGSRFGLELVRLDGEPRVYWLTSGESE